MIQDLSGIYWGDVVAVDDSTKSGRIRVRVRTLYDELQVQNIPWADAKYQYLLEHDLPAIGDIVKVTFVNGNIHMPEWYQQRGNSADQNLPDSDYASASIIVNKDLSKYGLDGILNIRHTDSDGLLFELTRSESSSIINIRKDNSVLLRNGKTEHTVHLSDTKISLGSEDESAEPGVLGDTNEEMLNKLNDFISELADTIDSGLASLQSSATSSPYTAHLAPAITTLKAKVVATKSKWYQPNQKAFPSTKSNIVSLD